MQQRRRVGAGRRRSVAGALRLCMAAASLAAPLLPGAARAEVPVSENASRRFNQGVRYLTSQDPERYEKAYREFKAAYADSPSWKILGNLGIVAHELERDGEAIDAFRAYLERGGKELGADERRQFEEDLALVLAGHSTVKIRTQPPGAWIIDERLPESGAPVVNRYGPAEGELVLRVRAGHHRIRAALSGHESEVWELSDPPGATSSHVFELRPEAAPAEPSAPVEPPADARADAAPGSTGLRVGSYVALGLGALGIGAGTYFLIDGFDRRERADALFAECSAVVAGCAVGAPGRDAALAAQDAEGTAFTRSLVGYVAGGALLATGVVLLVLSGSEGEAGAESGAGAASLTPFVGPDGLGVAGRF